MRIYIAHPLAGDGSLDWGDQGRNVDRYLQWVAEAMGEGHTVITWVHHWLTHERKLTNGDFDYYLSRDCSLIEVADELWICGPPSVSKGMRVEIAFANKKGIRVIKKDYWRGK